MGLQVTSVVAALLAMLMFPLALIITMRRIRLGNLVFGDGGDETLLRRIRAHGNFVEYVPLTLIVLGLAETGGAPFWLLVLASAFLIVGRILHAMGALFAPFAALPRGVGMVMTHAAYLLPSIWILGAAFSM